MDKAKQLEKEIHDLTDAMDMLDEIDGNIEVNIDWLNGVYADMKDTKKLFVKYNKCRTAFCPYDDHIVAMRHVEFALKACKNLLRNTHAKVKELNKQNDELHKQYKKLTGIDFLNC